MQIQAALPYPVTSLLLSIRESDLQKCSSKGRSDSEIGSWSHYLHPQPSSLALNGLWLVPQAGIPKAHAGTHFSAQQQDEHLTRKRGNYKYKTINSPSYTDMKSHRKHFNQQSKSNYSNLIIRVLTSDNKGPPWSLWYLLVCRQSLEPSSSFVRDLPYSPTYN